MKVPACQRPIAEVQKNHSATKEISPGPCTLRPQGRLGNSNMYNFTDFGFFLPYIGELII